MIVRNGELQEEGMRAEQMNDKDVMAHLRAKGIQDVREVKLALVEDDGSVSVLRRSWAESAQKADMDQSAAAEKERDMGGKLEASAAARTDAQLWLK